MRIPEKITYQGRTVHVKSIGNPFFCQDRWGDYQKGKIRLAKRTPRWKKEETFLHELIHMIDYRLEEKHVERIASRLYKVLTQNKIYE